jgi:hypothetical protein
MIRFIRRLIGLPAPKVKREEAMRFAEVECVRLGWKWKDPVIYEGLLNWTVYTDSFRIGSPMIIISNRTGAVVRSASLPR